MLLELHVKNLALIEAADVELEDGLNILTGETGAGKSIMIGSVNLALGQKASKEMIRSGAEYAYVELVFSVDPQKEEAKKRLLLENVCESDMEIKVVFDKLKLELRDIVQLQRDDIIPLSKSIESDVLVSIGKVPWFSAKLGETKQKKAVKLQNILSKEEDVTQWEKEKTIS